MSAPPLVSVVIGNYNYACYLGEAIESALAQTYPALEIVVVDDGSTDDSRRLLESYGTRIRTVYQANGGQCATFNTGAGASRGEFIAFLDADDVWWPRKVERVVGILRADPSVGVLRHRMAMIDAAGRRIPNLVIPGFRGTGAVDPHPLLLIEGRFSLLTSGMVLRRSVADRVFPIPVEMPTPDGRATVSLRQDADAYVAFRAIATGARLYSLDEVLGVYRRHDRQEYVGAADLERMISRHIDLSAGMPSAFTQRLGRHVVPSTVYKLTAALAGLRGERIWSRRRLGSLLRGLRRAAALVPVSPRVALRQALALAFAVATPRIWAYKLLRTGGYPDAALPPRRRRARRPAVPA